MRLLVLLGWVVPGILLAVIAIAIAWAVHWVVGLLLTPFILLAALGLVGRYIEMKKESAIEQARRADPRKFLGY